jgi:1-acyl-sn-glycerol-3-phosphate acyltransferase
MDRPRELGILGRLGAALMSVLAAALFRIRVSGIERVPERASAVLAANHVSALDGVLLGIVVWRMRRRVTRFLTGVEFFRNPLFRAVLRAYRQIPLRRGAGDEDALADAVATLRADAVAGIFPEGRVNAEVDGRLQPGRTGVARIALASAAPVVPVGIWGTQRRWPRSGLRLGRPIRPVVTFAFGAPVRLSGDPASREDTARETERVMAAIRRQVDEARALAER